jgi:hypothetical protein
MSSMAAHEGVAPAAAHQGVDLEPSRGGAGHGSLPAVARHSSRGTAHGDGRVEATVSPTRATRRRRFSPARVDLVARSSGGDGILDVHGERIHI